MKKKVNSENIKSIHPDFDGHLEKPLSKMTPKEKLDYLWLQMEFKYKIKNVRKISKEKDTVES